MNVKEFKKELLKSKKKNLLRKPVCLDLHKDTKISIRGHTFLNFSSNDYLNLSKHPEILETSISAVKKYGLGSGASRLLSGTYEPHRRLEKKIACFKKSRAALVFNTGYAANTGIISALAGEGSIIFSDELNHASIIDGARLSKAVINIYRHRDVNHLESLLKKSIKKEKIKARLIITDTVFSMDGDIAPLRDLVSLSKRYDTLLMVDDAHGTGVIGKTGRGALEFFGLRSDDIIQMGTLSKAFGCFGGFVAGSKELVDFLINKARSFIYSTSLPPLIAEASIKSIDIIERDSDKLTGKLWENRERLYRGLADTGFDTLGSETPIIPVMVGGADKTLRIGRFLYRNNIFSPAIRPPTVPDGKCRIRFSVTAGHTKEEIDAVLETMERMKKKVI